MVNVTKKEQNLARHVQNYREGVQNNENQQKLMKTN